MEILDILESLVRIVFVLNVPPIFVLFYFAGYLLFKSVQFSLNNNNTIKRKKELDKSIAAYIKDYGLSFEEAMRASIEALKFAENHDRM